MTRESNSAPAWHEPTIDERVLETVHRMQEVNQLGPSELRRRAKTIPLGERPSISQVPALSLTSRDVVAIEINVAVDVSSCRHQPREQYRPVTEEQSRALKALRGLPCPLTPTSVSKATGWTRNTARRWLSKFADKGVLVARTGKGAGHYWSGK